MHELDYHAGEETQVEAANRHVREATAFDQIIAEQAAYYGLSVERFGVAMSNLAALQEQAETEGW